MFKFRFAIGLLVLLLALPTQPSCAQGGPTIRQKHAWGRCPPGSWKQVRVQTDTLDEKGQIASSSVTETLTTLEAVTENDFTLRIDVTVDVGGKRFLAQPQVAKQGFHGETDGQKVLVRKVGDGNILINGRTIPCETREVTINGGETKRTSLLQFAESIPPFIMKRDTTATDAQGKTTTYQTMVEVVALDMPYKVMSEIKNTTFLRTVNKQPKGNTVTIEVHCDDVPGGVVSHTSREDDEKGHTIRRSTLELIDFGKGHPDNDVNAVGRRRMFRGRGRTTPNNLM